MRTITFAGGTALPYLAVYNEPEFYDNAHRRVARVELAADAISLDTLDALLDDEAATAHFVLENEETEQTELYDNYCIKMELATRPVQVDEDEDGAPVYEKRIVFKLGRLTPTEAALKELKALLH